MQFHEKTKDISITLNATTYDFLKAVIPMLKNADLTPELLAAHYIEERVERFCSNSIAKTKPLPMPNYPRSILKILSLNNIHTRRQLLDLLRSEFALSKFSNVGPQTEITILRGLLEEEIVGDPIIGEPD